MAVEHSSVIQKIDTGLNADTVEWCPFDGFENLLLCGTYKLYEETNNAQKVHEQASLPEHSQQTRIGKVSVYRLTFENNCQPCLEEQSKMNMCGVLDIKWPEQKLDNKVVFGLVDAEGFCQLFAVNEACITEKISKAKLNSPSLGLSLGFSSSVGGAKQRVAASDSSGFLSILDIDKGLEVIDSWQAHDYEAWITAFHKFDGNLVFSGGDDCRLKGWDIRDLSRPVFISKRHQMGVCSIQSHPFYENIFASGSYDEDILVWDKRTMKMPLASASLGGGVWRIKWNPVDGAYILTATMYNGTHIVDYRNASMSEGRKKRSTMKT
ncbi:WD repeat domain 85 [Plakobranchus ocellatus]|uniref:methylated diphthine methylhydrolase n=1 Tax=Plakobranchus ocellatus TaxID=259542 RepID=A0AAV4AIP6_9GAST|nr:WD repeat domain 85 [Plakobranchus ocellatus]